jgi:hypothetical protein
MVKSLQTAGAYAHGQRVHGQRVCDVPSAEEFYKHADEHFEWADTARTEHERAIFLQMASAWLAVAQGWEASAGCADDERVTVA